MRQTAAAKQKPKSAPVPDAVQDELDALGLDAEQGRTLHAQIARALEAGARPAKRRGTALAKARTLARHPSAGTLAPAQLIPLVFAVRDSLRAEGNGRSSRARLDRLDKATDVALLGIAETQAAEQKRGHDSEFAATREILQRLIAATPDAILTVRASGRLGQWNAAASRMTGRRRWEIQRRGLDSLFREKDAWADILAIVEERGRIARREESLLNTAGEEVPVRVSGVRLKAPPGPGARKGRRPRVEGDPDRYLLLLHDLSEVHNIRRRLIETEKLSAMAKIAGSVAHEFRNPLNSLFLSTDLLEDELEGDEAVQASIAPTLAAIREEIERLNQIITHYLALSKIAGSEPEVMDLGDVVTTFVEDSLAHWTHEDVTLRARSDEGHHRITADPSQVRRILVNLVENAVDAVKGEETGEEKPRKRGTITVALRRMRRSVKLTVKDNGPGIPEENRERVFEPFFTSKAGGSGLGLYLVREIVLASGGTMSLSSTVGRGTTVSMRWPFAEESSENV